MDVFGALNKLIGLVIKDPVSQEIAKLVLPILIALWLGFRKIVKTVLEGLKMFVFSPLTEIRGQLNELNSALLEFKKFADAKFLLIDRQLRDQDERINELEDKISVAKTHESSKI